MSLSSANSTCAVPWLATSRTTTGRALTCRSTRMRPTAGQLSSRNSAGLSRFAKSVASTIATSDGRPDAAQPVHHAGDSRVRPLAAHLGPLSFAGGPQGRGPKRLAVLSPTRYRESPGVPCPVAKARAVVNRVGGDFREGQAAVLPPTSGRWRSPEGGRVRLRAVADR